MTTQEQTGKRESRREPARETRITATVGKPFRARLRRMAGDANVSESQLVLTLVREALNTRDSKPRKARAQQTELLMWTFMTIEDIERALAACPPLVINASTPRDRVRRRRRKRPCCTCRR